MESGCLVTELGSMILGANIFALQWALPLTGITGHHHWQEHGYHQDSCVFILCFLSTQVGWLGMGEARVTQLKWNCFPFSSSVDFIWFYALPQYFSLILKFNAFNEGVLCTERYMLNVFERSETWNLMFCQVADVTPLILNGKQREAQSPTKKSEKGQGANCSNKWEKCLEQSKHMWCVWGREQG